MPDDLYQQTSDQMQKMAEAHFGKGKLSAAEIKLVRKAVTPYEAVCGSSADARDPSNDPGFSQKWESSREVRAEVIRWLCVDRDAKVLVDPLGIQGLGARITGELNLRVAVVPFPIRLNRCRL